MNLGLELFPVRAMAAFAVNLLLVAYLIYLHFAFKMLTKGRALS